MVQECGGVPAEAVKALREFLDAADRKDEPGMRARLTQKTLDSGNWNPEAGPDGVTFELGEGQMEGETAVIAARGVPKEGPVEPGQVVMELPCMMVLEEGQWKLDLLGTMERFMGPMQEAMEKMASAMGEAMQGFGDAMAEGLSQAFGGEEAASLEAAPTWAQAELTPAPEELLPLPELEPLPRTTEALSEAVGTPVAVEIAMADLLHQFGSNEREVLETWFQEQLFPNWGELFSQAAFQVPLAGRLRAVRIEAARQADDRFLALDGSDLVYRLFLPHQSGYFSDSEVGEMLPGVLAGLPEEIDPGVTGWRLLPTDDEYPEMESYRDRVAPRYMRRISELLGRPVQLDVDWEQASQWNAMGRQLRVWGLNRIWGGLVLACRDLAVRESLSESLTEIRLMRDTWEATRTAKYADGVLSMTVNPYGGPRQGYYEYEIARVLAGETIE